MSRIATVQFEESYKSHYASIYRYFLFRTDTVMDAEDLVADVFLRSWLYGVTDLPWLYKVAHDRVVDYYRKMKPLLVSEFYGGGKRPNRGEREMRDDVRGSFERLTAQQQQIVHFRLLDYDYKEMAEMLGKSAGSLRVQHHRAVARMREEIG